MEREEEGDATLQSSWLRATNVTFWNLAMLILVVMDQRSSLSVRNQKTGCQAALVINT